MKLIRSSVVLGLMALFCSSAFGATEAPAGASSSSSESVLDHVHLTYFTIFRGPTLGNLDSPYTVNEKGRQTASKPVNFDGDLTAMYMAQPNTGVGIYAPFQLVPVLGQGIVMGDMGVKLSQKRIAITNNLVANANVAFQFSTATYSQARGQTMGIKATPDFRYNFSGSRFTLGSWTEMKAYLGVNSGKTFKLWALPYVSYRFTPSLSATLGYEMEADHFKNAPGYFNFTAFQTDLQPGLVWMVTPKVLVNPYVQLATGNSVSLDTTALGVLISATLL